MIIIIFNKNDLLIIRLLPKIKIIIMHYIKYFYNNDLAKSEVK